MVIQPQGGRRCDLNVMSGLVLIMCLLPILAMAQDDCQQAPFKENLPDLVVTDYPKRLFSGAATHTVNSIALRMNRKKKFETLIADNCRHMWTEFTVNVFGRPADSNLPWIMISDSIDIESKKKQHSWSSSGMNLCIPYDIMLQVDDGNGNKANASEFLKYGPYFDLVKTDETITVDGISIKSIPDNRINITKVTMDSFTLEWHDLCGLSLEVFIQKNDNSPEVQNVYNGYENLRSGSILVPTVPCVKYEPLFQVYLQNDLKVLMSKLIPAEPHSRLVTLPSPNMFGQFVLTDELVLRQEVNFNEVPATCDQEYRLTVILFDRIYDKEVKKWDFVEGQDVSILDDVIPHGDYKLQVKFSFEPDKLIAGSEATSNSLLLYNEMFKTNDKGMLVKPEGPQITLQENMVLRVDKKDFEGAFQVQIMSFTDMKLLRTDNIKTEDGNEIPLSEYDLQACVNYTAVITATEEKGQPSTTMDFYLKPVLEMIIEGGHLQMKVMNDHLLDKCNDHKFKFKCDLRYDIEPRIDKPESCDDGFVEWTTRNVVYPLLEDDCARVDEFQSCQVKLMYKDKDSGEQIESEWSRPIEVEEGSRSGKSLDGPGLPGEAQPEVATKTGSSSIVGTVVGVGLVMILIVTISVCLLTRSKKRKKAELVSGEYKKSNPIDSSSTIDQDLSHNIPIVKVEPSSGQNDCEELDLKVGQDGDQEPDITQALGSDQVPDVVLAADADQAPDMGSASGVEGGAEATEVTMKDSGPESPMDQPSAPDGVEVIEMEQEVRVDSPADAGVGGEIS